MKFSCQLYLFRITAHPIRNKKKLFLDCNKKSTFGKYSKAGIELKNFIKLKIYGQSKIDSIADESKRTNQLS